MATILTATTRTETARTARAVAAGRTPAVLYGHGVATVMLWIDTLAFDRLFAAAGESSVIDLKVDNASMVSVLVRDVQRDALSQRVTHIDLYQVDMKEEITVDVPLVFVGEAPAVKELGGVFVHPVSELSVRCLPKDLPHEIVVDISGLKDFDAHVVLSDVTIPAGVTIDAEGDIIVASVAPPRVEQEEETPATPVADDAATDDTTKVA